MLKDVRIVVDFLIDISFLILGLVFITFLVILSVKSGLESNICTPESIKNNCNNDTECVVEVYRACNTSISFETTLKEKEDK